MTPDQLQHWLGERYRAWTRAPIFGRDPRPQLFAFILAAPFPFACPTCKGEGCINGHAAPFGVRCSVCNTDTPCDHAAAPTFGEWIQAMLATAPPAPPTAP